MNTGVRTLQAANKGQQNNDIESTMTKSMNGRMKAAEILKKAIDPKVAPWLFVSPFYVQNNY